MELTKYHAKYYAYELTKRSSSDSIEKLATTLLNAKVDLNPHQVDAALFAFKSPLSKGAILADEVGLGKTIEAGIVISQKWAERKRKILIIVPSNLRKQWNQELQDKFYLQSILLESNTFNQKIKRGKLNPFDSKNIIICSYHFARNKEKLLKQINWDLVVIDEAHRLRNVYKPKNKIAKAIKDALDHAPKILLTATPLQNSLLELFGLVSVIDGYSFGDLKSFKNQFSHLKNDDNFDDLKERLNHVCKRTLRRQVIEYIKYTNRIAITQEFVPTDGEQKLYDLVSHYLQRAQLYALPASQRHLMTLILRRLLASSTYAISSTLKSLSIKLQNILTAQNKQIGLEKDLSSEFEAYEELKDEWEAYAPDVLFQKEEAVFTEKDRENIKKEIIDLNNFYSVANSIKKNAKGEALLSALNRSFKEIGDTDVTEKAKSALEYCKHASEYTASNGGKPWVYVLIPHSVIKVNMGFDSLVKTYEFKPN